MTGARPPFDLSHVETLWSDPAFTEPAAREMFLRLGLGTPPAPDAAFVVSSQLNELARTFALDRWGEVQPGISQDELGARRLALACRDVLRAVGLEDADASMTLLPFAGAGGLFAAAAARGAMSGEKAVTGRLIAVDQLRQDADALTAVLERRRALHPPRRGASEQRARKRLVAGLACLYRETWNKEPGVSRGGERPHGPFVSLMVYVAERIMSRLGLAAISDSTEALATVWERLRSEEQGGSA